MNEAILAKVVKADGQFRLLVLPADRRLASHLAKKNLGVHDLRFAAGPKGW